MAPSEASKEPRTIAAMFSAIAPRYDLLNHLLSCGLDAHWRGAIVRDLARENPKRVLDLCAGTGDLSLAMRQATGCGEVRLVLADFALPMLQLAQRKLKGQARTSAAVADGLRLPVRDDCFDGAMSAFGVRNFVDLEAGLCEALRALRPGGQLSVLEFFGWGARELPAPVAFFIRNVVPAIGRVVSGHASAYAYLKTSIEGFVSVEEMVDLFHRVGFVDVRSRDLSFGICSLVTGRKGGTP